MLDDFGQRIRDIILSEMDLSRELSDEEICDLIGSVVSREARDRPMTIKDRAERFLPEAGYPAGAGG